MKDHALYLSTLATYPLFSLLPDQFGEFSKSALLHHVTFQHYQKDELIFLQHTPAVNLYFLLDGQVACHRGLPSGQECLIASYDELGLINENTLWDWQYRPAPPPPITQASIAQKHTALLINQTGIHQLTATATKPSIIASLSAERYFGALQSFELGKLIRWFCECMSKRMYQNLISSDLLAFNLAESKLAYYFLTHYPIGQPFELPCQQKQLAAQIGLRPETLSRTLKQMTQAGLIGKDKTQYRLLDAEKLLALVSE